jgi:hypothetical protein
MVLFNHVVCNWLSVKNLVSHVTTGGGKSETNTESSIQQLSIAVIIGAKIACGYSRR